MYLELPDAADPTPENAMVMEIFHSDETGMTTLTAFRKAIPLAAVEWLIERAKTNLQPLAPN